MGFVVPADGQSFPSEAFASNPRFSHDLTPSSNSRLFLVFTGYGGGSPGQFLDKSVSRGDGESGDESSRESVRSQLAFLGATLGRARIRLSLFAKRRGPRSKAEIEQERREKWERACREVDEVWNEYFEAFRKSRQVATGVVYARYSTRFQDSIADQVRAILEHALSLGIYVPRTHIFFDLAVRGRSLRGTSAIGTMAGSWTSYRSMRSSAG
jgi:hypothetical protein